MVFCSRFSNELYLFCISSPTVSLDFHGRQNLPRHVQVQEVVGVAEVLREPLQWSLLLDLDAVRANGNCNGSERSDCVAVA